MEKIEKREEGVQGEQQDLDGGAGQRGEPTDRGVGDELVEARQ